MLPNQTNNGIVWKIKHKTNELIFLVLNFLSFFLFFQTWSLIDSIFLIKLAVLLKGICIIIFKSYKEIVEFTELIGVHDYKV